MQVLKITVQFIISYTLEQLHNYVPIGHRKAKIDWCLTPDHRDIMMLMIHVCLAVIYGPYTGEYTPVGGRTRAPLRGRFTHSTTGPLASLLLVKMPCGGRFMGSTTGPRSVYDSWRCPLEAGSRVAPQARGQFMTREDALSWQVHEYHLKW